MIARTAARVIRRGIIDGRKYLALALVNPGLTSADLGHELRGLYGRAYTHTALRSHWRHAK